MAKSSAELDLIIKLKNEAKAASRDARRDLMDLRQAARDARGEVGGIGPAAASSAPGLGALRQALSFATGLGIVEGIKAIGREIVGLGRSAYDSVADYERLGMSLNALVAKELSAGQETTVYQQGRISLTDKERAKLEDLRKDYEALSADIPAAQARLEQSLASKSGLDPRIEAERRQSIAAMKQGLAETAAAIGELEAKEGALAVTSKTVWVNQMSMADAMEAAGPRAKELLDWIEMLAIKSPFSQESVSDTFRQGLAYGFTTKETQRMVKATIDWAAATGAEGEAMSRVGLALGQIQARGNLAGQEVLQLVNAGIPVKQILARAFNVTTAELQDLQEKGLLPAEKVIDAILKSFEEDFPDAAAKQASSLAGLGESLEDLWQISQREFFGGIFRAAQPYVSELVDTLASPSFRARLRGMGDELGRVADKVLLVGRYAMRGDLRMALYSLGVPQDVIDRVAGLAATWSQTWGEIKTTASGIWSELEPLLAPVWAGITGGAGDALGGLPQLIVEKLQGARDELTKIENWIGEGKAEGKGLLEIGFDIAGRLITGIVQGIPAKADELAGVTEEIRKWAESPAAQDAIKAIGSGLGSNLAAFLATMLSSDETGEGWGAALAVALEKMLQNAGGIVDAVGGELAASLTESFLKGMGVDEKRAGEVANLFRVKYGTLNEAMDVTLGGMVTALDQLATGSSAWEEFYRQEIEPRLHPVEPTMAGVRLAEEARDELPNQATIDRLRAEFGADLAERTNSVADLWGQDAELRQLTGDELKMLEQVPRPQAEALLWALEVQGRAAALKRETEAMQAITTPAWAPYAAPSYFFGGNKAGGMDEWVYRPTVLVAGEEGPEHVRITPAGAGGEGNVTIYIGAIHAPGGPAEVRQAAEQGVMEGMRAKGMRT